MGNAALWVEVGGLLQSAIKKRVLRVAEHTYTYVTFILAFRFALRSGYLKEEADERPEETIEKLDCHKVDRSGADKKLAFSDGSCEC